MSGRGSFQITSRIHRTLVIAQLQNAPSLPETHSCVFGDVLMHLSCLMQLVKLPSSKEKCKLQAVQPHNVNPWISDDFKCTALFESREGRCHIQLQNTNRSNNVQLVKQISTSRFEHVSNTDHFSAHEGFFSHQLDHMQHSANDCIISPWLQGMQHIFLLWQFYTPSIAEMRYGWVGRETIRNWAGMHVFPYASPHMHSQLQKAHCSCYSLLSADKNSLKNDTRFEKFQTDSWRLNLETNSNEGCHWPRWWQFFFDHSHHTTHCSSLGAYELFSHYSQLITVGLCHGPVSIRVMGHTLEITAISGRTFKLKL